jgi:hypothetical protein
MMDRRLHPRVSGASVRQIAARVRPGRTVSVLDVSRFGALVEAPAPLRPGARIDVHLADGLSQAALTALVTRCRVCAIDPDTGVTYEAALAFDAPCRLVCEGPTQNEQPLPASTQTDVSDVPVREDGWCESV